VLPTFLGPNKRIVEPRMVWKLKAGDRVAARLLFALSVVVGVAGCGGSASRLTSHMQHGQAYFAAGDFAHASLEFRNALQIAPKNIPARLMAARC